MKRVRFQIATTIIGCCLLLSLALNFVSSKESVYFLNEESTEKLQFMSSSLANEFGIDIKMIENTVKMIHSTIYTTFDTETFLDNPKSYIDSYFKLVDPILLESVKNTNGIQGIYFTLNPYLLNEWHEIWYADLYGDGNYEEYDMNPIDLNEVSPENPDYDYYFLPISSMKGVWISPYFDALLDVYMISYVEPIYKGNVLIGAIGADLRIDDIAFKIRNMEIYDSGFAMLINQNNEIVIHPHLDVEKDTLSSQLPDLKPFDNINSNVIKISSDKENVFFSYSKLPNNWYLAIQVPESEVLEKAQNLKLNLILITIIGIFISCLLAIFLSYLLGEILQKKSDLINETQAALAETEKTASLVYLVSGIAHEINTPVGNCITLSSHIENISNDLLQKLDANTLNKNDFNSSLSNILNSAQHIMTNLNSTKKIIFSLKELGEQKTEKKVTIFNVHDALFQIISTTTRSASPISLDIFLKCDNQLTFKGDIHLFNQIFYNLIENSVIHGFEGLYQGNIFITVEKADKTLLVEYSDDGKGIDSSVIDNVFIPYFSTKFSSINKGLGLNVVYSIIKNQFNGSIKINNQSKSGVIISFRLFEPQ